MELLPAILPALRDVLDPHVRERISQNGFARIVGIDRELRRRAQIALLDPGGETVEEPRSRDLGFIRRYSKRDASESRQRNALFSRPKKPSSSSGFGT